MRYAVSPDLVIFQDTGERHVFYYLPDEFRLTRDDVPSPTYKPSLQIAFHAMTSAAQDATGADNAATDYRVQFTFRAVPYLLPHREAEALRYIEEHKLVSGSVPAALLPLAPSSAVLTLLLPKEGGGTHVDVRTGALDVDIDFERLWLSVFEKPGWDDITQDVAVTIDSAYFTGPSALEKVVVSFNAEEQQIAFTRDVLRHDIELVRPFLPFLRRLPSADDYFFRVESWRKLDPASEPVKIAETPWTNYEGPALAITPPQR